jgi:hypothetical protein
MKETLWRESEPVLSPSKEAASPLAGARGCPPNSYYWVGAEQRIAMRSKRGNPNQSSFLWEPPPQIYCCRE